MGHYAYEVQEATAFIKKSSFEVVEQIKNVVNTDEWACYGWRNDILRANSIKDIAKTFGIELANEDERYYRPVIDGVYVSNFFPNLINIVAPYMTDGVIKVDDEYDIVTIVFENGKAKVYRE